ncbi:hypothetical protein [Bacteroides sp.]|uniref:hypothetical protein n=1 Tax=Bacteroides sp. TaxID=29523 RepID=UPI00258F6A85|nr:hypothetical protein [Bacteroides sp.]
MASWFTKSWLPLARMTSMFMFRAANKASCTASSTSSVCDEREKNKSPPSTMVWMSRRLQCDSASFQFREKSGMLSLDICMSLSNNIQG